MCSALCTGPLITAGCAYLSPSAGEKERLADQQVVRDEEAYKNSWPGFLMNLGVQAAKGAAGGANLGQ
jgi:hypothetical protein